MSFLLLNFFLGERFSQIFKFTIFGDNSFVSMKELGVMPVASALSERHGKYRVKDNVFRMQPMEKNPR